MRDHNPYSAPAQSDESNRPLASDERPERSSAGIWFRCWLGIGVAGAKVGFFIGGAWGLLHLGLRAFVAGLVASSLVFSVVALIQGTSTSLSRKSSMRASVLSGLLAGLALFLVHPSIVMTLIISFVLAAGGVASELVYWESRDHERVVRMTNRFRGVDSTFRLGADHAEQTGRLEA